MNGMVILGCAACFRSRFLSRSPSFDFDGGSLTEERRRETKGCLSASMRDLGVASRPFRRVKRARTQARLRGRKCAERKAKKKRKKKKEEKKQVKVLNQFISEVWRGVLPLKDHCSGMEPSEGFYFERPTAPPFNGRPTLCQTLELLL